MLNTKKKSIIILLITFILLLIGATQVKAAPNNGELIADNDKYLYDPKGNQTIETVPGANYNPDTNTLTLNEYNGGRISAYDMSDFKINLIGNNTITYDVQQYASAIYTVLGTFDITGTGTLNIIEANTSGYVSDGQFGAIHNHDAMLTINGPTINILNSVNSGIVARNKITIENANITINTIGKEGIASKKGDICINGNSTIDIKNTLNDEKVTAIRAEEGIIKLTTTGKVVLEKVGEGTLCYPEILEENETIDGIYKYDIIKETNKASYIYKTKINKNLIDVIEIDGTSIYPVVGGEPKYLPDSTEQYNIIEQDWYDEEGEPVTKFEEGKEYVFFIRLEPKNNYYFSDATTANITKMDKTTTMYDEEYGMLMIDSIIKLPKTTKYTVTVNYIENSTSILKDVIEVLEGEKLEKTILPTQEYIIKSVKIKNQEQILTENVLTINNIKENIEVVVELEKEKSEQNSEDNKEDNDIIDDKIDNIEKETSKDTEIKNETTNNGTNNPKTGDSIVLFTGLLVISIVGIAITTKFIKNK